MKKMFDNRDLELRRMREAQEDELKLKYGDRYTRMQKKREHNYIIGTLILIVLCLFGFWIVWNVQRQQVENLGETIRTSEKVESEQKQERESATSTTLDTQQDNYTQETTNEAYYNVSEAPGQETPQQETSQAQETTKQEPSECAGITGYRYVDGVKYHYHAHDPANYLWDDQENLHVIEDPQTQRSSSRESSQEESTKECPANGEHETGTEQEQCEYCNN